MNEIRNERDNSGVLYKNDRKEQDNHPDYRGAVTVGGKEFWLSAWIRTSKKDGKKFMSLALQGKTESGNRAISESRKIVEDEFTDDIPF
jgi:uncharacterized protein (DUF736 family)